MEKWLAITFLTSEAIGVIGDFLKEGGKATIELLSELRKEYKQRKAEEPHYRMCG